MPAGVEEAPPVGGGEGEAKIIPLPVPMFKVVVGEKKSGDKKVEK
jgi:hypothetical protein